MMHILYQRLALEWKELDIAYPQWLTTLVMNDVYYITTLLVACVACFEMGVIIGIVVAVV